MAEVRLQKHLRGTSRALVEGALEEFEIGLNNDTNFEELITLVPGTGFIHYISEERLDGFQNGLSGASLVGVEDDSFGTINGDVDLQTTLKSVDDAFNTLALDTSGFIKDDGTRPLLGDWQVQANINIESTNILTFGDSPEQFTISASSLALKLEALDGLTDIELETNAGQVQITDQGNVLATFTNNINTSFNKLRIFLNTTAEPHMNFGNDSTNTVPDSGDLWLVSGNDLLFRNGSTTETIFKDSLNTFTATLTGVSGTVNVTAEYQIIGKFVHLYIPAMTGTSNSTVCTIIGLPLEARPDIITTLAFAGGEDSGAFDFISDLAIQSGGTIDLRKTPGNNSSWTGSGSKGLSTSINLIYRIP